MAKSNHRKKQSKFTTQLMERLAFEIQLRRYRQLNLGLLLVSTSIVIIFAVLNHAERVIKLATQPSQLAGHWGMYISTLAGSLSVFGLIALGLSLAGYLCLIKYETISGFIRKTNITKNGVSNMSLRFLGGIKTAVIGGSVLILSLSAGGVYAQFSPTTSSNVQAKQHALSLVVSSPKTDVKKSKPSICPAAGVSNGCPIAGCKNSEILCKPPCLQPVAQNVTHLDCGPTQPPVGVVIPPCLTPIAVGESILGNAKANCGPSQPPIGGGGNIVPGCYGATPMMYPVPPNYNCGSSTPPSDNISPPCLVPQPVMQNSNNPGANCGPVQTGTGQTGTGSTGTGSSGNVRPN